jgi:predicted transcriptional regulator YdeE
MRKKFSKRNIYATQVSPDTERLETMPKTEIKSHPKRNVVGLKYHGKNQAGEIPQLWGQLMGRAAEIQARDWSVRAGYGVSIMGEDYEETMVFDYIAGFPVLEVPDQLPPGMGQFTLPEQTYAVITVPNLDSISSAYDAVYRWIAQSEAYAVDLSGGNFNFELYGEEFMPDEGSEMFFIYVPVKEK